MTDIKKGDRVHVEFDGTVSGNYGTPGAYLVSVPDSLYEGAIPTDFMTVIVPPLPTKVGAVIRHIDDMDIAMRARDGLWVGEQCDTLTPDPAEWEVLFEGVES